MPVLTNYDGFRGQRNGAAVLDYTRRFTIGPSDLDAVTHKYHIGIADGEIVLGVRARVLAAMDVATTLDVGDTDADGWLDSGTPDVDPTSLGAYCNSIATANAYAKGKAFPAGGLITVTLDDAPTTGSLLVEVECAGFDRGIERGVINPAYIS